MNLKTLRAEFGLVMLAIALVAVVPASAGNFSCSAPRCLDVSVPVPAGLTVPDNRVRILFPQNYNSIRIPGYPVLYLLHGAGDSYLSWTQNTDVFDMTRALDLIVVMPDGGGSSGTSAAGWYSD